VRLVDSELRTLAATDGFVAFEQLSGDSARHGVTDALAGRPAARVDGEGRDRAVIVARSVDDLPWAVVSEKPVRELSLPGNEVRRGALLVALIGGLLAILLFGWHYLVLIRPLRTVAAAGKFTGGEHGGDLPAAAGRDRHHRVLPGDLPAGAVRRSRPARRGPPPSRLRHRGDHAAAADHRRAGRPARRLR
jgi:hypothetical protein